MADPLPGWRHAQPPFHPGEQAVQARAGVRERLAEVGPRVMRDHMPDQHRELFEKLPFMVLGALDAQGRPWATLAAGEPGFVRTPDARTLVLGALPLATHAIALPLRPGTPVGLLGIELPTRRRNRVNGTLQAADGRTLTLRVQQSFGNCPKYIQARPLSRAEHTAEVAAVRFDSQLPPAARTLVRTADTFFIATASPDAGRDGAPNSAGVDVSHRGGKPGFVRLQTDAAGTRLIAPDFVGNFFFNTLGNIETNPHAGLAFVDWRSGDLLLLTGRAQVLWEGAELARFAGAQRLLVLDVAQGRWLPRAMPWRATEVEPAPQLAATGSWEAAAAQAGDA